jgi:uncharacterized repeat protein (TIGR03803 family)
VTEAGGSNNNGTIFKITTSGSLTTIYNFSAVTSSTNSDGVNPENLIPSGDGNFYGAAGNGGSNGTGTIFEITPSGSMISVQSISGAWIGNNGAIRGSDGNFYTMSDSYTGEIYIVTQSGSEATLHTFSNPVSNGSGGFTNSDGAYPEGLLVEGNDGNYYGSTDDGGAPGYGTLFKITSGGSLTTLYSFNGPNGKNPYAGLIKAADGSMYGTTDSGGAYNGGTIYKLSNGSVTLVGSLQDAPQTPVVMGRDGNFYGTSSRTVYMMTPSGSETNLGVFVDKSVLYPSALVEGNDGNFYGTTYTSVFEVLMSPLPVAAGTLFNYQIAASNTPTSYGATGLPPGVSVNTTTGLVSGTPTMSGNYNLILSATNNYGTGSGTLPIVVLGPDITTQPGNQAATTGQVVTFTVTATGSGTVTYQWQKNGGNITGANGSSYSIPAVAQSDAGSYSVVVTDSTGSVTTSFNLSVSSGIPATPWWALGILSLLLLAVAAYFLSVGKSPASQ